MYCDLDHIKTAMTEGDLIQYTDDAGLDIVDETVVNQAIAGACSEIDPYLARRYTVPLSPVPERIRDLAVDIAVYRITWRKGSGPEGYRTKYEDAVRSLKDLSAGNVVLPGAAPAEGSAGADSASITSDSRVFSRDSLRGF